jgi:DNA-binding response OmpR family regulator
MSAKILIVEDDQDIRRLLGLELEAEGFTTAFARDAVTAISVARKEQPQLAILDLGLPGGDGFLVMERLRAFGDFETLPIVVVTARTTPEARERAEAAGVSAFFEKPFDADQLVAKVREILG